MYAQRWHGEEEIQKEAKGNWGIDIQADADQ